MAMKRPNGSGSVVKMSGRRRRPYAVRVFDGIEMKPDGNGRLKYKYIGYFEKQKDALQYLEKFNTSPVELAKEIELGKKHKFSEVYDLHISELKMMKDLSEQSYRSRQAAYKHLKNIHNMAFESITLDDLETEIQKLSYLSSSSINNIRVLLKGMYFTAMRHKYVKEDISALLIATYSKEPKTEHIPFTDEEIQILWQHSDYFYCRVFLILIYTGLRINELLNMKSEDVHLEERYMIGGSKTEAGKGRIIPISEKILPLLDVSGEYLIMVDNHKVSYQKARKIAEIPLKNIGLEHYFHDTRHTCASLMERAGIDILHRKLILGHKSKDITDRYTHVDIQALVDDINTIK